MALDIDFPEEIKEKHSERLLHQEFCVCAVEGCPKLAQNLRILKIPDNEDFEIRFSVCEEHEKVEWEISKEKVHDMYVLHKGGQDGRDSKMGDNH